MKIGLITIHWANSYGGCLQALATQEVLSTYGDVDILDYKTKHLNKTMWLIRFGAGYRDILRAGKDVLRIFPRYRLLKKFHSFMNEFYSLSESCIDSHCLSSLESHYDVFICGSDQIWNPNIIGKFDLTYFLSFVNNKKKISYASSMGSYKYSENEESKVTEELATFSSISVREEDTALYIKNLLKNGDIKTVLDPTLLLGKERWLDLLNININELNDPYVFIYTLKKDDFVKQIIRDVSSRLKLKIVVIDQDPFLGYPSDQHIKDADPRTFVELIAGASFVITNSFHGTAFAVNFEVPFLSLRPEVGVNRLKSFLANVGLEERLITEREEYSNDIPLELCFDRVRLALSTLREDSLDYLDKALNE